MNGHISMFLAIELFGSWFLLHNWTYKVHLMITVVDYSSILSLRSSL